MKTTKTVLLAASLLLSAWLPAQAETLTGALSQTLARNPALASARFNYEANYTSQFVSLADMLPQVHGFVTQRRSDTEASDYTTGTYMPGESGELDTDSYGVRVTQQVFTSGRNLNAFRAKRADVKAERARLTANEQQILLGAIAAYMDVLESETIVELRRKNVDVLSEQLDAVKDRFEVGVVTRTDIAQSQAALSGAKASLLGAEAGLRGARASYREFVGLEAKDLQKPKRLPRLPRTLERAIDTARKESPTLKIAQAQAESGRLTTLSTLGTALPSVNFTGTYAKTEDPSLNAVGSEVESTSVELTLNVPIFQGGRSLAAITGGMDFNNALRENVHAASNQLNREVITAWHNVTTTKSALIATEEQITAAELALEGVRAENRLGTRTNLDVLDAEEALLNARVNLANAERNQYVAAYSLLSTIGRLTAGRLRIEPATIEAAE